MRSLASIAAFLVVTYAVAAIGGAATASSVAGWYQTIDKPSWTPPDAIFGPVWTILYGMMAVAAWLVWRKASPGMPAAMTVYFLQLALNLAWSLLFFGLRNPLLGLIDIAFLWASIAVTVILFWRETATAGLLLVPYLGWVTYASALNLAIWRMN